MVVGEGGLRTRLRPSSRRRMRVCEVDHRTAEKNRRIREGSLIRDRSGRGWLVGDGIGGGDR